jgi:hypothetical protein
MNKIIRYILHVQTICMSKNIHLGYNDLLACHHLHFVREQETTRMLIEESYLLFFTQGMDAGYDSLENHTTKIKNGIRLKMGQHHRIPVQKKCNTYESICISINENRCN